MSNNDEEIRKILQNKFDPHSQYEKLKSYKSAFNTPLFERDYHETYKVNLKADPTVSRGKFLPTLNPNEYKAHPITIRAVRPELFMGGEDFIDLECLYICTSCKCELDIQFWKFCPFCEAPFR